MNWKGINLWPVECVNEALQSYHHQRLAKKLVSISFVSNFNYIANFFLINIFKWQINLHLLIIFSSFFFFIFYSCTTRYVGEFCEHLNPCHTSSGPRCQNGGLCEVDNSSAIPTFKCRCPIGYTASLCEISERNACDSGPCRNGGQCHLKSLHEYGCSCAQGYTGKFFKFASFFLFFLPFLNSKMYKFSFFRKKLWKTKSLRIVTM